MKAVSLFGWLFFNYKNISYLKKRKFSIKLDCGGGEQETASMKFNVHSPWTTFAFSCLLISPRPSLSSLSTPPRLLRFWDVVCSVLIKGHSILYFLVKDPSPHTEPSAPLPRALESTVCNEKINGAFLIFMACVFLIISPWMQSLAFVPKPHKAGSCSSQSEKASLELTLCREQSRQPPAQSKPAQTPSLPTCPSAGLLTSSPASASFPYTLPHILRQNRAFPEHSSYPLTALLRHLRRIPVTYMGSLTFWNGPINMYHVLFHGYTLSTVGAIP